MMSDRSTRNGSGDKKSRMTRSTEIKVSVKKACFQNQGDARYACLGRRNGLNISKNREL